MTAPHHPVHTDRPDEEGAGAPLSVRRRSFLGYVMGGATLVAAATEHPWLGFIGERRVNVLELNLSLDSQAPRR